MKFITGSIFLIFALLLVWGCTAKKDIITEQSAPVVENEVHADNASLDHADTTAGGNNITDIKISETQNGDSQVFVYSQTKLNYTIFKLSKPDRIIVDVPEATSKALNELNPETGLISTVRSSVLSDKDIRYVRIEIFLKKDITYSAQCQGNTLQIDINKKNQPVESIPIPSAELASLVKATNTTIGKGNLVQLQIKNHIPRYRAYKLQNPSRIVVELDDTLNQLKTGTISINENFIDKIRFGQMPKSLKIVIDIRDAQLPSFQINKAADMLSIAIGSEALAASPKDSTSNEDIKATHTPDNSPNEIKADSADGHKTVKNASPANTSNTNYTGEKISLDFKDADLKNILRLLGDISGINMTIGDKVSGKATLKLDNVPSDEALDIVLINNGLDKTVTPQYTRIDTVEQIKKFNDDRAQAKKSYEQAEDTTIKTFSISYAQASNLAQFIKQMNVLTPTRGSVNFFELTNKLTISDIPQVIAKVEKIISEQDIPTRQVMIETRVVQSAPGWVKDFGIAWGGTQAGHHGGAQIPLRGAAGTNNEVVNLLGAASGAINVGYITDRYALDATLTAYESEDKIKILSNPRILSLDNKESSIKQGVQLPYLKLNENGVTSTEFKDAVLEMKVKPKITAANTIAISVDVKKDQKSSQTGTGNEPGIDVRQIKTDLLVESGKTVVIGGIYENTKSKNIKKVPFFADIPIIGYLFRSVREDDTLTEMLVFITVTIVESPNKDVIDINAKKG